MAHPNIQLLGATYPTVPSVLLPVAGGGQAEFFDMADDMAWLGAGAELVTTFTLADVKLSATDGAAVSAGVSPASDKNVR